MCNRYLRTKSLSNRLVLVRFRRRSGTAYREGILACIDRRPHQVSRSPAPRRTYFLTTYYLIDLHAVLTRAGPYQASSIHSRRRLSFASRVLHSEKDRAVSPAAPSPLPPIPQSISDNASQIRNTRERRLLSDLWLMSAATFRRLEKLDQARGAIQEAEALDEENENICLRTVRYLDAADDAMQ